jgi:lycopene beta-cyclase
MSDPSPFVSNPTRCDPALAPAGRETYYVLAPVPNLRVGRQSWRDGLADQYADELVTTLEARGYVGFGSGIEVSRVVTPADWADDGMFAGTPFADIGEAGRAACHRCTGSGSMSPFDVDAVIIAGGGLSGLSLAAQLATNGWHDRSVLVVDDSADDRAAVCWGSWSTGPDVLDAAVSRRYRRIRVHAAGVSTVVPMGRYRYQVVRRSDLGRAVSGILGRCPHFAVRSGRVEDIRDGADAAEVVVDGRVIRAGWVFDSVMARPTAGVPDARLAFTGWEVRCSRPVFDAGTPTLFDFRTPQGETARFIYVLPDDAHRALVEFTEFVPRRGRPASTTARDAALADYLCDVMHASDYEVLRTESAVLPLRAVPPPRRGTRVLAIGARGGLVKASTGYAYQRIQRDSAAIARSLARHGHPFDIPRSRLRHRLLDTVFLDVLDRDPGQLERTFARLFSDNPGELVLRFLDERSSPADELRLIASMPKTPYVAALAARAPPSGRQTRRHG